MSGPLLKGVRVRAMTTGKRHFISKGKGYLSAAGPQARFIVFLLVVLILYSIILRVFQKLAEIVQLPIFLPVSLLTLLLFISVAGTVYSHKFVGPLARIRRTVDQIADGDLSVSLRVRESDDPILKDLVSSLSRLCDCSRRSSLARQEALRELEMTVDALRQAVQRGALQQETLPLVEAVRQKQSALEQSCRMPGKA